MNWEIEELSRKAAFLLHLWEQEYGFDVCFNGNVSIEDYKELIEMAKEEGCILSGLITVTLAYIQELAKATPEKE